MLRRHFLSALPTLALAQRSAQPPPNIALIFADDLGYGDLSCYGNPVIKTPHLDQLAAEGIRFTQFYSAAPLCSPSRAALLTGRYPVRTGVNVVLFPDSTGGLPPAERTMAEVLKSRGYRTGIVGKWHLGHLPQYLPTRQGFDSYFGIPYSNDMSLSTNVTYDEIARDAHRPPRPPGAMRRYETLPGIALMRNEEVLERDPDQTQITRRYTEEAQKFLTASAKAKQPFFLYFPHTMPHVPLFASERFRGKSLRGRYGDAVEELDWSVGEVMRTLRQTGQEENTLVVFTSDNGGAVNLGRHGGSNGMLREGKATTWEGGMREPFLARWKGKIKPGQLSHEVASTLDLLPTFARLSGAELPASTVLDGRDLGPVLFDGKSRPSKDFHYYHQGECRGLRRGAWKLHRTSGPRQPEQFGLYNVEQDPAERFDEASRQAELFQQLLAAYREHVDGMVRGAEQR
ncbi:MAG: sulfatase [Bryobacter sp.]